MLLFFLDFSAISYYKLVSEMKINIIKKEEE